MNALVLDSEAFSRLARSRSQARPGDAHAALAAAFETDTDVLVPAAVLAEQYRGGAHDQTVDSCLSQFTGIEVVDTTRLMARVVGNLLARAGRGSADHVDATVVATALLAGGGTIATADVDDLMALVGSLDGIVVEAV